MILRNKLDREAFVREKTIESMKSNSFLQANDIVLVSSGTGGYSFYNILSSSTDPNKITLNNGLFAVLIKDPKRYTKEEVNAIKKELSDTINSNNSNLANTKADKTTKVTANNGLVGGGTLANSFSIGLDPLSISEIQNILNFEKLTGEFSLATDADIRNLFNNVKLTTSPEYKLGSISPDESKIVNMKLLSLYNDLNLQQTKKYDSDLKSEVVSLVNSNSSKIESIKNSLQANIDKKVDKTISVNAGTGLNGGGALSSNVNLTVDYASDKDIQDMFAAALDVAPAVANKVINLHLLNVLKKLINEKNTTGNSALEKKLTEAINLKEDKTKVTQLIAASETKITNAYTAVDNTKANKVITITGTGALSGGGSLEANRTITHKNENGYKHIPSNGANGQYLKYSAAGTAVWVTPTIADISDVKSVTVSSGLVGGGNMKQNINVALDPLSKSEIDSLLSKYKK